MQGRIIAYLLIGIGVFISLVILLLYLTKTSELNSEYPIDINIFSSFGSVIGGIVGALFSLAGIFLLINTLESQEKAINLQQANFEKQLFESKFFDLLKIHRENSSDINVYNISGREGFLYLQKEFSYCKEIIDAINEAMIQDHKLKEEEIINISYLCFFYGAVSKTSKQILKEKLSNYEEYQNSILDYFKEKLRSPETKKKFPLYSISRPSIKFRSLF